MSETTEIATLDSDDEESSIELLPAIRDPDMVAITTLREHVGAMRDAKFFAEGMCYTALVPDRFRGKPGDGAAAILYGAELGLSPIASLRSIIVIHGQPGLEARTMKALLKAKGYKFKTHEATDEACDIEAFSPDGSESERCRFTIDDAIKAELVPVEIKPGEYKKNANGKLLGNMKYLTEPRTMLRAKATAVVCREIAPHILLGMPYSADELSESDDWATEQTPSARHRPAGAGVDGMRAARERREAQRQTEHTVVDAEPAAPEPAPAGPESGEKAMTPATRKKWSNRLFQLLAEGDCPDRDDQIIVITATAAAAGYPGLVLEHRDDLNDETLRAVVTQLNQWSKANKLGSEITEILNRSSLAEMEAEAARREAASDDASENAEADLARREAEAEGTAE